MVTNAFPLDRSFLLDHSALTDLDKRLTFRNAQPAQLADALSYEDLSALIDIRDRVIENLLQQAAEVEERELALSKMARYENAPPVIGKLVVYEWANDYNEDKYVVRREDVVVPLTWLHNAESALLVDIASGATGNSAGSIIHDLMPDVAHNHPLDFEVSDSLAAWLEAVRNA